MDISPDNKSRTRTVHFRIRRDNCLIRALHTKETEECFLIQCCNGIGKKTFVTKYESLSRKKIGNMEFLYDCDSKDLMQGLNRFSESILGIPRIRVGKRQTFETLISEGALLLAKYLRDERKDWNPRIPAI